MRKIFAKGFELPEKENDLYHTKYGNFKNIEDYFDECMNIIRQDIETRMKIENFSSNKGDITEYQ